MRTSEYFRFRLNSEKPNHILINEKAIEKGHTDSMDIYASDSHDLSYTDTEGNRITIGKRLTQDRKKRVEITIINSYQKHEDFKKQRLLIINND